MPDQPAVQAHRVPLQAWNTACRFVAGDPESLTDTEWSLLAAAGLSTEPGSLVTRWDGLIRSFLGAPSSVRVSATHRGLLYRSSLTIGPANICVLERFTTRTLPDGQIETINRDDQLEVSVTEGHPWALLRRVIPPLPTLQAPPRQTAARSAKPVDIPASVLAWAAEQATTRPADTVLDTLKERSSGRLHDFFGADDASVSYAWTTAAADGPRFAFAWYLASEDHLFRSTFDADAPFEEVRRGDFAFTFQWHLLGVLDALGARAS